MPVIQVVLFDLGGTLLHYERPPEFTFEAINARGLRAFVEAAIRAGARVVDPELAIRAVGRMAGAMEAKAKRTYHANTAENIIREGLDAVKVTLSDPAWKAAMAAYYGSVAEVVQPVAGDAPSVLAELVDQGRALGLVSNTFWSPEMHDADLARFDLLAHLPVRVYSSAFGMVKPYASIFRKALDELDVAPAEAVFVGDKLDADVVGPQKMGMRAVLVESPFREERDPAIHPDARIKTIAELPELLEEWDRAMEATVP